MSDSDDERPSTDFGAAIARARQAGSSTNEPKRNVAPTAAAASSGAGNGKRTSAAAATVTKAKRQPVAYTPQKRTAAPRPALNANDVDSKPTQRKTDTVSHVFNVAISYPNLAAKNGGKSLELNAANKTLAVKHSNQDHRGTEAHAAGDLDFVQTMTLNLTKEAVMPLRYTTDVPAMKDEHETFPPGVHIAENSTDPEKAPYGLIALDVQAGQKTASYSRTVTEAQATFFEKYPGQTAENVGKFVRALQDHNGNTIAYQVKAKEPQGAVTFFYNEHKDIKPTADSKGRPDLLLTDDFIDKNADAEGYVSIKDPVGMKALKEALDTTKKTLRARVGYTNISNADKARLVISGAPQTELDGDHKSTQSIPPLTHVFRNTAAYQSLLNKGATAATALGKLEQDVMSGKNTEAPKFCMAGTMEYGYHKVTQNFQLIESQ